MIVAARQNAIGLPKHAHEYERHLLHTQSRNWAETNCYVDVWIELLHAYGFEPRAALAFTLGIDCEGDQWTFFKFPLSDLRTLFGLEVQELAIWRPLTTHIDEQVQRGRPVLVELDSFYLPDTAGMAYQLVHQKSTVAIVQFSLQEGRMGYFHGQGYYELSGDDFSNVFRLDCPPDETLLPPYVEIVKPRAAEALAGETLVQASIETLHRELARLPSVNPFLAFRERFKRDLSWLTESPLDVFHQYSFATLRQFGACYELAENYLRWLQASGTGDFASAVQQLNGLSTSAKTLQFQLARAVSRKKQVDLSLVDQMGDSWTSLMDGLKGQFR